MEIAGEYLLLRLLSVKSYLCVVTPHINNLFKCFDNGLFIVDDQDPFPFNVALDVLSGYLNPVSGAKVKIDDLELAPSSDPNDDPGKLSLYVADYGADQVNDGRLFEIDLGNWLVA